jgi:hypothetical protein
MWRRRELKVLDADYIKVSAQIERQPGTLPDTTRQNVILGRDIAVTSLISQNDVDAEIWGKALVSNRSVLEKLEISNNRPPTCPTANQRL